VLSAGKQLSDHLRQAPEVVGDGEEHPMYPVGHQVLEDLNSERPLLPALEHPEPEDVLGSPRSTPTATNNNTSWALPSSVRSFPQYPSMKMANQSEESG